MPRVDIKSILRWSHCHSTDACRNLWTFLIRLKSGNFWEMKLPDMGLQEGLLPGRHSRLPFQGRLCLWRKIRPAVTYRKSTQMFLSPVVLLNSIRLSWGNILHLDAFSLIHFPAHLGSLYKPLTKLLMNQLPLLLTFIYIWILCSLSPLICHFSPNLIYIPLTLSLTEKRKKVLRG